MEPRQYVPFDAFGMREEVRVSSLVRVGGQGWTCGQCPLDTNANVVAPGDLNAQAEFVCAMIHSVLARGGFESRHVAQLTLYHAAPNARDLRQALSLFRQAFPHGPVILPVTVPYFYYEGMMLEVDVIADETVQVSADQTAAGLQRIDGQDFAYVAAQAGSRADIENIIASCGAAGETLLDALWFAPVGTLAGTLARIPAGKPDRPEFEADQRANVILTQGPKGDRDEHAASLLFSKNGAVRTQVSQQGVVIRETASTVILSAPSAQIGEDLPTQAHSMMIALAQALDSLGLSWAHVVKVSAPYVGNASADALHENLRIRHSFHALPGPASTGLPVTGFAAPQTRIFIQVIARR